MARLGRGSGAAAALLFALLTATPASPAGAAEGGPEITIDSPRSDQALDSASVTVSGRAAATTLYLMKTVKVTFGSESKTFSCSESPCAFSWTVPNPPRANGGYQVTVAATQALPIVATPGPSGEATRSFTVAAPAAKPTLDPPKVNEARNTELSWSRNTEPDMLYYALFRKDPGASKYLQVGGKITHPASGSKVAFTDTTTSAFLGGEYSYQVVAVRRGAASGDEIPSDPSTARAATVPAPPTAATPTTPAGSDAPQPGAPTPSLAPTTTAKPGTSAGVDLSGFLSARSQPTPVPTITVPEPPDTGFNRTLPFGARPAGDDLEEGAAEAVLPNDRWATSVINRISPGRPLVPVAGGLVLLLLAMHMRVLGHRIKAEPAGDLPIVEAPVPRPAPAEAARPPAAPAPAPPAPLRLPIPAAPPLYDVAADWTADSFDADLDADLDAGGEEWAPTNLVEPDGAEPATTGPNAAEPDEIEVFEVVSSNRRPLARTGAR